MRWRYDFRNKYRRDKKKWMGEIKETIKTVLKEYPNAKWLDNCQTIKAEAGKDINAAKTLSDLGQICIAQNLLMLIEDTINIGVDQRKIDALLAEARRKSREYDR